MSLPGLQSSCGQGWLLPEAPGRTRVLVTSYWGPPTPGPLGGSCRSPSQWLSPHVPLTAASFMQQSAPGWWQARPGASDHVRERSQRFWIRAWTRLGLSSSRPQRLELLCMFPEASKSAGANNLLSSFLVISVLLFLSVVYRRGLDAGVSCLPRELPRLPAPHCCPVGEDTDLSLSFVALVGAGMEVDLKILFCFFFLVFFLFFF